MDIETDEGTDEIPEYSPAHLWYTVLISHSFEPIVYFLIIPSETSLVKNLNTLSQFFFCFCFFTALVLSLPLTVLIIKFISEV